MIYDSWKIVYKYSNILNLLPFLLSNSMMLTLVLFSFSFFFFEEKKKQFLFFLGVKKISSWLEELCTVCYVAFRKSKSVRGCIESTNLLNSRKRQFPSLGSCTGPNSIPNPSYLHIYIFKIPFALEMRLMQKSMLIHIERTRQKIH